LNHNILNGFHKQTDPSSNSNIKEHKELLSKLESPQDTVKRFTITPSGVLLRKGEQIGMFEMGSTIALIVECPMDYEFKFKEGQKLKMGEEIMAMKV
jgi:phosphatidylserine decarboxylase